ncbi:MAG: hypothetical protein H0W36_10590, partial [Gemmatimonadetes bacterium]|nr:hypothetical protein [Gemmatimonadota bacterium]
DKAWVNDVLVYDEPWTVTGYTEGFSPIRGFTFGNWSGELFGPIGDNPDMSIDFARIAWADGPIGCGSRAGLPPEEPAPDPDALHCDVLSDNYATARLLAGECGRAICRTDAMGRESWETYAAGFPSELSLWYRWIAPRAGRFIFRTRGSEVFNEVSVYRHTGATPPPLLPGGFSEEDPWDPDSSMSSAVEVEVEKDVEYRIRIASASEGWTILDFGPAKPVIQDDGWSINEGARETRTREFATGLVSGLAIQDDQLAAAANGAGALPTLDGILFGTIEEF